MNRKTAENYLKLGIFGAVLTLIGDMLIGFVQFPEGTNLLGGYIAAARDELPIYRPILGGLIGCLGICLEVPALLTIYPLFKDKMPKSAVFYKISVYGYLALGGGAVHLPCGVLMWLYRSAYELAGTQTADELTLQYFLYFLLPVTGVFFVFFFGANIIQFIAFVKGNTPFPKWYCVFNLLIFMCVFNSVRLIGSYAITNGIATSNKSLGAIVMFAALLVGFRKYVYKGNEI